MENKAFLLGILLLLSVNVCALQASYMYTSLSFWRSWEPWVNVVEEGKTGICGCPEKCYTLTCDEDYGTSKCLLDCVFEEDSSVTGHLCPFEAGAMGCNNLPSSYPIVPFVGFVSKFTIPEDLKLVTPDGRVVADEVCVGDKFRLQKGVNKGEYWQDGGNEDSPPVYWVDDVEKIVDKVLDYHRQKKTQQSDVCPTEKVADGYVDQLTGLPLHSLKVEGKIGMEGNKLTVVNYTDSDYALFIGNMICSLKEKGLDVKGLEKQGDNYVVLGKDVVDFTATFDVECAYYLYGEGFAFEGVQIQDLGQDLGLCLGFNTLKVPLVIQAGPEATVLDWGTHNVKYYSKADFFKVGNITLKKTIKVVDTANPKLSLQVQGAEDLKPGEKNVIRVLVKNEGVVDAEVIKVSADGSYSFISCDSEVMKPGDETECLLSIAPAMGQGLKVDVDYRYKSCGKTKTGSVSKVLIDSTMIMPAASAQVYSIDVHGGCENQYYGCYSPDNDGKFAAGYECYNTGGQYYSPVRERFDLRFVLPDLTSKTVLGASLNLFATNANRAQEVRVFSGKVDWTPTSCSASGDICARPYCEQCAPLFDFAGGVERSAQTIGSGGKVSYDLTDQVKEAYSGGLSALDLQVRGEEDVWASAGKDSCGRKDDWIKQDAEFAGIVGSKPYLEIVYM